VQGYYKASGVRPKFMRRLKSYGIDIADDIFDPGKTYQ
jgi:pilus assembly protein CpaF